MKQPKYRGFSLEENSWQYGHGWFEIDYTDEYKKLKGLSDKAILYRETSPIECELSSMGQYTGQKDINGTEIYEGDLLRNELGLVVVIWDQKNAWYAVEDKNWKMRLSAYIKEFEFEIEGDIHYPKLLNN